jgi:hypothetical protein
MKTKILLAASLITQLLTAQTGQKKSLPDFTRINANVSTTIVLQKADAPFISMMQDSGASGVKATVSEGILTIRAEKDGEMPSKITVGYLTIDGIDASGAVTIKSNEVMSTNKLDIDATGAAKCKLEVSVNTISCNASGAATISLSGGCGKIEAIISGAANLKADNLIAENGNVSTSGAATAKVNVTNKLEGNASGASTLKYTGNPKERQINQSGASSVKRMDVTVSTDADGKTTVTTTTVDGGDSTKKYTINGRYEILVHERKNDTTTTSYKHKHDGKIRKQNWTGVELFENGFVTSDNDITLPISQDYMSLNYGIKNMGCNLNLFEKDFRMAKGKLQFVTGLGFSWNSYNLKNKTTLNSDSVYTGNISSSASFAKNKLKESFITVPLLFELNTSKKDSRNFHIAFGVIGGAKLGSSTKQIYSIAGHEFHETRKDDYNLFPFKLDATMRVGYGDFTMFATYSLTPLFEYGKGPELYPFTIGVRIVPF